MSHTARKDFEFDRAIQSKSTDYHRKAKSLNKFAAVKERSQSPVNLLDDIQVESPVKQDVQSTTDT